MYPPDGWPTSDPRLPGSEDPHESPRAATITPPETSLPPGRAEAYLHALEQAGPPFILVDPSDRMIHSSAAAGAFLVFDGGAWTDDLRQAIHPALRVGLHRVLAAVRRSQQPARTSCATLRLDGQAQVVRLHISPLGDLLSGHLLIAIEPQMAARENVSDGSAPTLAHLAEAPLRQQLDELGTRHAAAINQYQTHAEELRTMNEELLTTSEQLRVSQQGLRTLNRELTAANRALAGKIEELGRAHGDLQNLVAAAAIATVFLDRSLHVTRYTPAAAALFHLATGDVGRPLARLRHDLDYPDLEADAARVLDDQRPSEREVGAAGGGHFLVRLLPYRTVDDRILGVVLTCVDITERKQAEAHRQAKEAAERLNQARGEFLSRMSHELRTPLNAILGFGQILEAGDRDEPDRQALGLILQAGRHLLALVDEVLDISRADRGELRLTYGPVDLARISRECVHLVARLAEARQVDCRVGEIAAALPPLWTDEQRLRQVLLNLLSNALKYNRPGGRVTLDCQPEGDEVLRFSVRDTGLGIAAEDLPRLFTPFERLHQHGGEIEGTGLGLAITRRLTEALGGEIGVESEPGQGSHFWVRLPYKVAPAVDAPEAPDQPAGSPDAPAPRAATLLCIEDNASNLALVEAVAARYWPHWRLLTAHGGRAGLALARRHQPDLILLDLQLPDHPGEWVLAGLRRDPRTAHLPIVVLSADATARSREQLLAAGATGYLCKPFQIDELLQTVQNTLSVTAGVAGATPDTDAGHEKNIRSATPDESAPRPAGHHA